MNVVKEQLKGGQAASKKRSYDSTSMGTDLENVLRQYEIFSESEMPELAGKLLHVIRNWLDN